MSALAKVLVVDDDPVVGKSFDRVLSGKGYIVVTARDGVEALNKLRDEEYDVVFTDIKMPGMDGLEVAEKVKARRPWTPVVIVTGYGSSASEERARAAGVADFLHKPLSPEMIEGSALKAMAARTPTAETTPAAAPAEAVAAEEAPAGAWGRVKDLALFLAAPFLGLAYVILLPFAGIAALAWLGGKELAKSSAFKATLASVKDIGLLLAAPFVGLAFLVVGPFVGLAALLWHGGMALVKREEDE